MADDQTQEGRRLRIDTALNAVEKGDPFLLIKVHGIEHFSQPYKYEISMLRHLSKRRIDPTNLINTIVKIGVSIKRFKMFQIPILRTEFDSEEGHSFITRFGVFESVTDEGKTDDDFRTYSAVIVPAFKMMDREFVFRVFELKNVRDIIREVTREFPNLAVNQHLLDQEKPDAFPIMEYCVQFRESSFNFLSRLMAQFGIWYFFEHNESIGNCSMILGRSSRNFKPCQIEDGDLKGDPVDGMVLREKQPSLLTITDFHRAFSPAQRLVRSGNFNILAPVSVIDGKSSILADHDLINPPKSETKGGGAPPTDAERFRTEIFPADARVQAEAEQDADIRMQNSVGQVFTASGNTRNPAFVVGRKFYVTGRLAFPLPQEPGRPDVVEHLLGHDLDPQIPEDPATEWKRPFLLTHLEFFGGESFYSRKGFFEAVFGQAFDPSDKGPDAFGDLLLSFTTQGLNNYLQNEFAYELQNKLYPETQRGDNKNQNVPYLIPFAVGGGFAAISALLPALKTAITDLFKPAASDYTNSFQAVPLDEDDAGQLFPPLPPAGGPNGWVKPVTNGPHLAVVIGPHGVDDPPLPKTRKLDTEPPLPDIHADKLGRVRVRFPWDRKADEVQDAQFNRGDTTCWVRVSEGWAGRGFGTQFLPRIGQEVIVDFIDGDPDRPIITGRVYNADHGLTNLPFPGTEGPPQTVNADDLLKSVGLSDHDFRFSGLKTRSIPSRGPAGNPLPERFHLLRLNDERDKEQYLIRSQHRLDVTAFEKRYESIHSDRHLTVGGKWTDPSPGIAGDYIAHAFKDYHLHVGDSSHPTDSGNRTTLIEQNDQIKVVENAEQAIGGDWSTSIGGQVTIDANGPSGTIVLNATTNITLTVGDSSIVITPASIAVTAPMILINSGGPPPKPPIDPNVPAPKDPIAADPGDTLTPQE